jgi:hypothetical protein
MKWERGVKVRCEYRFGSYSCGLPYTHHVFFTVPGHPTARVKKRSCKNHALGVFSWGDLDDLDKEVLTPPTA